MMTKKEVQILGFEKRRRELRMMTSFPGISLDVVGLVVWSVVQVSNPLMDSVLVSVTEWVSSIDTVKLYELSSMLYDVLEEWLANEIMEIAR